ncbi:fructose-1,6-bisphosphatase [Stomatobaculum longum]|uniref:fructose-1,6-bisphosphatase n=1 Tax=Stomatobaculum longum TaxID=796942 RepID=UPI0028E9C28C|nr:fructose-1,6-bisphosphatase [Stomatobaculum longum]
MNQEQRKYLSLLAEKFPTRQAVCTEIINLAAIMNLPKGTEHFMSDIHGEYDAFLHIMNNCSGVIREKIEMIFADVLNDTEKRALRTLIYYPKEALQRLHSEGRISPKWYRETLRRMIEIARVLSSKYTRSKVRKAMPKEFGYIIDELLHALPDEDGNQLAYHERILDTIVGIQNGDEFIIALAALIKRLAVDHLHIVGDLFDRGADADKIIELLLDYPSLDIQWGNHDVLWMGAAAGNEACIANVVRNNVRYNNIRILESGYGISLRRLQLFAEKTYEGTPAKAMVKAINVMMFKAEGELILRHPEFEMQDRLLLDKVDTEKGTVTIDGVEYAMNTMEFPTVDWSDPYRMTPEEREVMDDLKRSFCQSPQLRRHIEFLYAVGSVYLKMNDNLLFHGCVPLTEDGQMEEVNFFGQFLRGKSYFEFCEKAARLAYNTGEARYVDFMFYLWGGPKSPMCGRVVKTFERSYLDDKASWKEPQDPYYLFLDSEATSRMILREFGLKSDLSHIINGHTPVHASAGENPIKAGGKLIVIDGGFSRAYHKTTGIAGYTLIYNSHGMRIKSHMPFESVERVISENLDIESRANQFEIEPYRVMVGDTDIGKRLAAQIEDLNELLTAYRDGSILERVE